MKKCIGVIGAGTMGIGVAHSFAQYNIQVILVDNNLSALENAKKEIKNNIRFNKFFNKDSNFTDIFENITFTTDIDDVSECEIIIENITENIEMKKKMYVILNDICSEKTIFAVNTSAIPITRIASLMNNPSNVIGVHFMNPVPLKAMVEVIAGYKTSQSTIAYLITLLKSINKECRIVNDSPGFITNRAMMIFVNEAIFSLYENVASKEDIDILFKKCFGHKMGPLQTADLIGLDTILYSLEVLYNEFNDPKYRPCPLLKKMVDANLLGMKSGEGFYIYNN